MKPKEERKGEKTPNSHTPDEVFDRPILQRSPCHHHSRQHCGKKEQHRHSRQQTSNPFPLFLHTPQRGKRRANRNMKKVQEDQSTNKTSPQTAVVPPLCFHFFFDIHRTATQYIPDKKCHPLFQTTITSSGELLCASSLSSHPPMREVALHGLLFLYVEVSSLHCLDTLRRIHSSSASNGRCLRSCDCIRACLVRTRT